ncbi:MAG TPA: RNA polymerase sigma factor [Polyangia bacterium]|jgi:RNA polymerase sigma-70 factor (ECF subfamily)|nr:RNA polymerase sigma factor [Polyangia bacterium]
MTANTSGKTSGKLLLLHRARQAHRELSDEDLLTACARGEAVALEELFNRHGDRVYRVLGRARGVDAKDLDDLVQSTFIEVFRSAPGYAGKAAVSTWLLGIAVNVMRHHVRGESRRRSMVAAATDALWRTTADPPDEDAVRSQFLSRLERSLALLPSDLSLVFTLCEIEGLRGVDVARALGIPEGTVWRRLHDARTRLRAALMEGNGP